MANISDQIPQDVDKHLSDTTLHTGLPAARNPYDVKEIAERIKERDRLAIAYAHAQWLENGRDLLRAKSLLDHGSFENWCRQTLNYSTRTAQKLMRAAETWDSWPKSEPGSVLPKPTVIYALSAPSVPQEIRELYAPRVTAGEDVLAEVRKFIKQRSRKIKEMNKDTCHGAVSSEPEKARVADAAMQIQSVVVESEGGGKELGRQAEAHIRALDLLQARLGSDLKKLLEIATETGGCIFMAPFEEELWSRAHKMLAEAAKADFDVAESELKGESTKAGVILSPSEFDSRKSEAIAAREGSLAVSRPSLLGTVNFRSGFASLSRRFPNDSRSAIKVPREL